LKNGQGIFFGLINRVNVIFYDFFYVYDFLLLKNLLGYYFLTTNNNNFPLHYHNI